MTLQRLSWRIGLPFVLLVLAETVTLAVYMTVQIAAEERSRLEQLADANANFLRLTGLPMNERVVENLQQVTGFTVFFRQGAMLTPLPPDPELQRALREVPDDAHAHQCADLECVAVSLGDRKALLLARRGGRELYDPRILEVLGAFWLLALLIAWLAVRGLVRPLRHLAAQLPGIESPGPLELPEATRKDEIGDVARAFLRTRQALHDEREHRARMEKLAVLGRMTAALAHELQNPIAAIKMHAQLWRGDRADAPADVIEQEIVRIEGLLNQWLFLSRPEPPAMRPVDLGELLAQIVRSHQAQLDHAHVRAIVKVTGPLLVQGDGKRLVHVFRNVLTNAIQAMPNGGTLAIDAGVAGDMVQLSFADDGKGFSAAALARFAEFFFSEKEGGMGIGLSVASEIVKAHHGTLHVQNRPEGGALVVVSLPRGVAPSAAVEPPSRLPTRTPTA